MVKFRLYYNKEKETAFLNEMSQKGYALTGFYASVFTFDRCQPGEYIYQIDFTQGFFRVSNDYREFMRDVDVEIVCLWGPWVILRKRAADGPFELYTDVESTINHYTKIRILFKAAVLIELIAIFIELRAAYRGNTLSFAYAFIPAAIAVAILRELRRINGLLAELKERQGLEPEGKADGKKRPISVFLPLGFLFYALGILVRSVAAGQAGAGNEFFSGLFNSLAIVCFFAALVYTFWKRR